MYKIRSAAVAATVACGLMLLGGTGVASAQQAPAGLTQVVPISGTVTKGAQKGKQFTGTYSIQKFVSKGGKLYSVGTLKGKAGSKKVSKKSVMLPVKNFGPNQSAQASQGLPPLPTGTACQILSLDLGPINLNLLGLVVRTNLIQLRIDAVQGAGNLLGNLLCGLTGILNPTAGGGPLANTPLGQLAAILNAILALVPRTA